MNDTMKSLAVGSERMLCPHCGQPLVLKGQIVNAGTFKKWVEEWKCSIHGAVLPNQERKE